MYAITMKKGDKLTNSAKGYKRVFGGRKGKEEMF